MVLLEYNLTICPICGEETRCKAHSYARTKECKKGCFSYYHDKDTGDGNLFIVEIFNKTFDWDQHYTSKHQNEVKAEIDKKIAHWKTNDRYLLKWMKIE